MTYGLGTTTAPLTGHGQIAVSNLAGVRVLVSAVPNSAGARNGTPIDYFGLGHLTPGDPNGWDANLVVQHTTQLFYPLRDGITVLGYSFMPGVTAQLQMLTGELLLTNERNAPWDRSPVQVGASYLNDQAPHSDLIRWTYTVPAGKRLWISHVTGRVQRIEAATSLSWCYTNINVYGATLVLCPLRLNTIGAEVQQTTSQGLILGPGQVLEAKTSCGCVGGRTIYYAAWAGFIFDA